MITWMQKHKKYLIITIWISTIAFIAAGMVGWGAYNFSSSSSSVAKVGDISISVDDFNREYQILYRQYNEQYTALMGKPLDNEQAKLLGLEDITIKRLIDKALLENFALDSGIRISDEDIAKEIQDIADFKKDGVFDASLYKEILKQNRLKPAVFEESIKKDLMIQKILEIFPSIVTPFEKEILSLPINLQDRLFIQIVTDNQIKVNITDKELEEFYENHKDSYKTQKEFEVEIIEAKLDDIQPNQEELKNYYDENKANYATDGVIAEFDTIKDTLIKDFQKREAQKVALKSYVDFKDSKIEGNKKTINENDINDDILQALNSAKDGDIIKPILDDDVFITIKVIKKIPQTIQSFKDAKSKIMEDYYPIAKQEAFKKYVESRINLFKGVDIGYFSIDDTKPIPGLADFEKQQLLTKVFNTDKQNDYLIVGNKAILYKIMEQKMLKDSLTSGVLNNIKSVFLEQTILDFLANTYKITNNLRKDS
ncbi:hypothetical protein CCY99_07680 [Helicobacter sp. 16-1353]|uniref:peptidylprolyl isomerase n=1 Tax=Helicobacter sp. 16-1353 TaxID=2004996 RepID=UPI000DCF3430|nr:peptidylprolyl isomerase [Helicobacter sp. 16-1353]RAX52263.1 hypothetical protein CCY99_07680 [Helicobacter sp. 16-1353]